MQAPKPVAALGEDRWCVSSGSEAPGSSWRSGSRLKRGAQWPCGSITTGQLKLHKGLLVQLIKKELKLQAGNVAFPG